MCFEGILRAVCFVLAKQLTKTYVCVLGSSWGVLEMSWGVPLLDSSFGLLRIALLDSSRDFLSWTLLLYSYLVGFSLGFLHLFLLMESCPTPGSSNHLVE